LREKKKEIIMTKEAVVAKAMRKELKTVFPGHKFMVTKTHEAVIVSWESKELDFNEVSNLVKKYAIEQFDKESMTFKDVVRADVLQVYQVTIHGYFKRE
jgi:hypothetical protein